MNFYKAQNNIDKSCEFDENLYLLRQLDFFSDLPLETIKIFAYLCIRETYTRDDYLFQQNIDDGKAFYIISGHVKLICNDEKEEQLIRIYEKGVFLGGLALVGKIPRLFSLKALTKAVCLTITREKFLKAVRQLPELMPNVFQSIVESIYTSERVFFYKHAKNCQYCKQKTILTFL